MLNIKTSSLLKATFLLYVFPVLAMIAGALLGQTVAGMRGSDPSGLSALLGFLFFGLAFITLFASWDDFSPKTPVTSLKSSRSEERDRHRPMLRYMSGSVS